MKQTLIGIILLSVVLGACSEEDFMLEVEPPQQVTEKEIEKPNTKEDERLQALAQVNRENYMLNYFAQESVDIFDVTYDEIEQSYLFMPVEPVIVRDMEALAMAVINGTPDIEALMYWWDELTAHFATQSLSVQEEVGPGYSIIILNPVKPDKMLLGIMDGEVYYNIFDEQN